MTEKFAGKVALVAGGTGGLGHAVTLAFLVQGATVVATYRRQDEWDALQKTAAASRQNLSGFQVDVTDESAVTALVGNLVTKHGRLDALVNTVGGYAGGAKLWSLDTKVWDQMFALNLRSGYVLARAVVP